MILGQKTKSINYKREVQQITIHKTWKTNFYAYIWQNIYISKNTKNSYKSIRKSQRQASEKLPKSVICQQRNIN